MFNKILVLIAVMSITTNVFAVPTVRRFSDVSQSLSNINNSNANTTSVITAKAAQVPTASNTGLSADQAEAARIPMKIKVSSVNKILKENNNQQSASSADMKKLSDRITALENKTENIITDVVSNDGTYVSDIVADGNKINVSKTNTLYVPVKVGNSERVTDNAEIWIVR